MENLYDDPYQTEILLSEEVKKFIIPINIKLVIKGEAIADLYSYTPNMSIKIDSKSRLYVPHKYSINRDDLIKGGIYNKQQVTESEKQKVTDDELVRLFTSPEKLIRISDYSSLRKSNKPKKFDYNKPEQVEEAKKEQETRRKANICNNIKLLTDLLFASSFLNKKKIKLQDTTYTIFKNKIIDPTTERYENKHNIKKKLRFELKTIENCEKTQSGVFWTTQPKTTLRNEAVVVFIKIHVSSDENPSMVKQFDLTCVGRRERFRDAVKKLFGDLVGEDFLGDPENPRIIPKRLLSPHSKYGLESGRTKLDVYNQKLDRELLLRDRLLDRDRDRLYRDRLDRDRLYPGRDLAVNSLRRIGGSKPTHKYSNKNRRLKKRTNKHKYIKTKQKLNGKRKHNKRKTRKHKN